MSNRSTLKPNRFRAAHSSFRMRMLHEQHQPTQEPVNLKILFLIEKKNYR